MKKNLISILILVLLVVNIVLTTIMMISVTSAANKTSALVTDISSALSLELTDPSDEAAQESVPMKNTEVYDIAEEMTVPLKLGEDGKSHFALVSVSLSQNIKDKGYKAYGGATNLDPKSSLIKGVINEVFGRYTMEEARIKNENGELQDEILKEIQNLFQSEFIFRVVFQNIVFQ